MPERYPWGLPPKQGLYDPQFEHDACGVGFVVNIKGQKSNEIVRQALTVLRNLTHRGAVGADPRAGDGAGILMQLPDEFLRAVCQENAISLPAPGDYGVAMVFLPRVEESARQCIAIVEKFITGEGQQLLGWRDVPVDNADLGYSVIPTEPVVRQAFIARGEPLMICVIEDNISAGAIEPDLGGRGGRF